MRLLVALVTLTALVSGARAEDAGPWSVGVSSEAKAAARVLLDKGNKAFLEKDYVAALESYTAATAQWDHPAIRFNMVRCLVLLDRVLEASENLERAMQYGPKPLEESVYNEALGYQKLLAGQVGSVSVKCTQPAVSITVDGAPITSCPGSGSRKLRAGKHQLVATKTGFMPDTRTIVVLGGTDEALTVNLAPATRAGKLTHRWPIWMPWVVAGSGLVVAGVGGLIEYQAFKDMRAYDDALVSACLDAGCSPERPVPSDVKALKSSAILANRIGVTALVTGGATFVIGGVLLYLNRARTVYPVEVAPLPGGASVSVRTSF